ncbi:MAG: 3'-5' exonuclease [Spirochaetaceae bacterium]|nr:MAG: 3'-5' exonuclease [Spirochaetaceae bacterium]
MDFSRSVHEVTFTAFDFETTGLYPATDRIVEFGAVQFQDGKQTDVFEALVDPGIPIPDGAAAVSGITNDMVRGKPPVHSVLPQFMQFVGDSVLVAHNAQFDVGFLRAALDATGSGALTNLIIDTQVLAQRAFPRRKSYGLQALVVELSLPQGTAHRGLDDAVMCMRLFQACVDALSFMGEMTLQQLLG